MQLKQPGEFAKVVRKAIITGIGIGTRSASGVALVIVDSLPALSTRISSDPDDLEVRLADALQAVADTLNQQAEVTAGEVRDIIEAQALMAGDASLLKQLLTHLPVPTTVDDIGKSFEVVAAEIASRGGYIGERADDIKMLGPMVIRELTGTRSVLENLQLKSGTVLVAKELSIADVSRVDLTAVAGVIVATGGPTGHLAIALRSRGVPAVLSARNWESITNGDAIFLNPLLGRAIVNPDVKEIETLSTSGKERRAISESLGNMVSIYANVGSPGEAELAAELGASGIGLVRTEFVFATATQEPSIEDQLQIYMEIVKPFANDGSQTKAVTFRTLDAGSDKQLDFIKLPAEDNPALGLRGIRTAREYPDLLDRQLRSLSQAAIYARDLGVTVKVMAPMVTKMEEVDYFVARARSSGLDIAGVMFEVPALVFYLHKLTQKVDFVSIGTNDLAQYYFAADRNSGTLADLLDPFDPAFVTLIKTAIDLLGDARKVSICGDAVSDPLWAATMAGIGVTNFSVPPSLIEELKEFFFTVGFDQCHQAARKALDAEDATAARAACTDILLG
jgi:phosphotransferase system enzyme I (PtsI)